MFTEVFGSFRSTCTALFIQGRVVIDEMITESSSDVFLLHERWLILSNLHKFDDVFTNYFIFWCPVMSKTLESGTLRGGPYGGIVIMKKNNLRSFTESLKQYTALDVTL